MTSLLIIIGLILFLMIVFQLFIKAVKYFVILYVLWVLYVNYDSILNYLQNLW